MSEEIKKGEYQGECNRSACSNQKAEYFNYSTKKYYCTSCAEHINLVNKKDAILMYGHDLCIKCIKEERGGEYKKSTPESFNSNLTMKDIYGLADTLKKQVPPKNINNENDYRQE